MIIANIFTSASFWVKALELIVALSLLVVVHEFGHYTFARLFKVGVDKFYLFFNWKFSILRWDPKNKKLQFFVPNESKKEKKAETSENSESSEESKSDEIAEAAESSEPAEVAVPSESPGISEAPKTSWRDTVYGIGWIPLGGYCAINGMIDETTSAADLGKEVKPWEFRSKPAWQRLLIMIGGVLFNFLLAIVIYAGIAYTWGDPVISHQDVTEGWQFSESAHDAGFQDGDILLAYDGHQLGEMQDDDEFKICNAKQVTVLRNKRDTVTITMPNDFLTTVNDDYSKNKEPFMAMRFPVVVASVVANGKAEKAGLCDGDTIVSVNDVQAVAMLAEKPVQVFQDFKGETAAIVIKHKDSATTDTLNVEISNTGTIGIQLAMPQDIYDVRIREYSLLESVPVGVSKGVNRLVTYVSSLKLLFNKDGAQQLGGFGTIGSIFPETWNWLSFWEITAFLSVILAFMNILPIPALDGGHVLFLLYEIITRRKPSEKFMERAQIVGMIILLVLLVWANANDIIRFLM